MKREIKSKARKIDHIHNGQDIEIMGSKLFSVVETIGFWLHIIALTLGILSLIDIALAEEAHHALEIVTLIVVGLIVFIHFSEPIVKRSFIHNNLKDLWGDSRIKTKTHIIKNVDFKKNYNTKITKEEHSIQEENVHVGWTRPKWYSRRKFVFQVFDENNDVLISILPRFIIIDFDLRHIRMAGHMTFPGTSNNKLRETNLIFKPLARGKEMEHKAHFYGNFPEYPIFGTFEWTKKKVKLNEENKSLKSNK